MWLVLIAGLPPGGRGIVLCVFPLFAVVFVFRWFPDWIFGWSLVFESISFRGFYWGPRAGVDSGTLPVSFAVSSSLPGWMPMHYVYVL